MSTLNLFSIDDYLVNLFNKITTDHTERRRQDRILTNLEAFQKPVGVLDIDKVHFYPKENAEEHHTKKYDLVHRQPASVVIRRGQPFYFIVRFTEKRTFDPKRDTLLLTFNFGPNPVTTKGTQAVLAVTGSTAFTKPTSAWDIRIQGQEKDSVTLQIQIPADVPVGLWKCTIRTGEITNKQKVKIYNCPEDIYILFNPWCHEDTTHMECIEELEEYVSNDVGKIWVGSYGAARGREWVYGQFDDTALPVTILLLAKSGLAYASRGNPLLVTRALTAMVNSNDGDNGVLEGNWSGEYSDGTAPAAWTGSVKILEEYLQKRRSVKYGQCWVFAGVLNTLCRALGIPARPVTNLVSAHDANCTLTIDRYYDTKGNELDHDPLNPDGGKDSVWNFHVWVEAWMARPDLPKGYGGWQAIDATPQERSGGFFQCGPASVEAVKTGQVGLAYDVPFVLAEVNADLVMWREDSKSEFGFRKASGDNYHVGRQILTKKVNVFDRIGDADVLDVTGNYKALEGTDDERMAFLNAARMSGSRTKRFIEYPDEVHEDVSFQLTEIDQIKVGEPFNITVTIHINIICSSSSIYYTGVKGEEVKRATGFFVLQPNAREEIKKTISASDYTNKLVEYGMMKIYCMASVKETNQVWAAEDDFQVIKPQLDIKVPIACKVGRPVEVVMSFKNPLKTQLTNSRFTYEGPGLARSETINYRDVLAEEAVALTVQIIPKYAGELRLVGTFVSTELVDVTGSAHFTVTK